MILEGLLFDMDGVVCDNNAFHKIAWVEYAKKFGIELTDTDVDDKVYGKTNEQILTYVLNRTLTKEEEFTYAEEKEALFRSLYAPHFALMPGLLPLLEAAKAAGIPCALATNAPESNMQVTLEKGGLLPYFKATWHAALVAHPKPAPDLYIESARSIGAPPSHCIVFEDSFGGIKAGIAAGATVVGIASTYSEVELQKLTPYTAKNFTLLSLETLDSLLQNVLETR
jgi:beta-phosphoglucomutase